MLFAVEIKLLKYLLVESRLFFRSSTIASRVSPTILTLRRDGRTLPLLLGIAATSRPTTAS